MLKRSLTLTAGVLLLAGCHDTNDRWLDTTADESFMDRPTTMESPPTSETNTRRTNDRSGYYTGTDSARSGSSRTDNSNAYNDSYYGSSSSTDRNDPNYRNSNDPNYRNSNDPNYRNSNDPNYRNTNDPNYRNTNDPNYRNNSNNNSNNTSAAASEDARILGLLHTKNLEEVEAGKLAKDRGVSPKIREFGEHMVKDHGDANRKVQSVASDCNITLPAVDRNYAQNRAADSDPLARLRQLQGNDFDREFASMMEKGHAELIRKVEDARARVSDQRVKSLLDEMLPILRHHHEMATELATR